MLFLLVAVAGLASLGQSAVAYPLFTRAELAETTTTASAANASVASLNATQLFNTLDGFAVLSSNFTQLVVFGDSLSDNGTGLATITDGTNPPPTYYFDGRFSNGPVWPEYLARRLGIPLRDYATGGATTDNALNPAVIQFDDRNITLPSTVEQIAAYLAENTTTAESLATTLHAVFTGGNDILTVLESGANITGTQLAEAVAGGVASLQDAGANAIVVVNLPSLEDTPASRVITAETAPALDEFDTTYRDGLLALESDLVTMSDTYNAINYVRAYADDFGLNATTFVTSCETGLSATEQALGVQYSRCVTQDTYVYWDSVHMTTKGHQIFASIVAGALTVKGWVTTLA